MKALSALSRQAMKTMIAKDPGLTQEAITRVIRVFLWFTLDCLRRDVPVNLAGLFLFHTRLWKARTLSSNLNENIYKCESRKMVKVKALQRTKHMVNGWRTIRVNNFDMEDYSQNNKKRNRGKKVEAANEQESNENFDSITVQSECVES